MNTSRRVVAMVVAAVAAIVAPVTMAVDKETSLVLQARKDAKNSTFTGETKIGDLAVAGRLSVDLHAEFMASRSYGTEAVLNWYNCGYSGGGGEDGRVTRVGGTFGDFGFQVPYADRERKYPHAVTVDGVRAIHFDGDDFLRGNFPVEQQILDGGRMAVEVWFRCDRPKQGDAILGWQSPDGAQTSATLALPAQVAGSPAWRHLVVNCTPDAEDWFLDGAKISGGKRTMLVEQGHVLVLGGASSTRPSFDGDIVAVRLHDDAMTDEEIAHNFTGGPLLGTALKNWWRTEADMWHADESEHFRHALDTKDAATWNEKQRADFKARIGRTFKLAELVYRIYSERLAMRSAVVSRRPEMRGDGIKYKTPIQPSSGSWMGVNADFGWACQGAGLLNPHELVHGWDAMTGNMQGNFWETHANFPQKYAGMYQAMPMIYMLSSCCPSNGRSYYQDDAFFEHLAQTPEYGPMFIAKLWYDGPTKENRAPYPFLIFNRINPYPDRPLADEYARMAMRNVTWDYTTFVDAKGADGNTGFGNDGVVSEENLYRKHYSKARAQRSMAVLRRIPYAPDWWRVPKHQAPQQLGWNICPLSVKPGTVSATLEGYVNAERGPGWRAGFVGVTKAGEPVYGRVFGPGAEQSFEVDDSIAELYLVVCAVPEQIMPISMTGDFRSFAQEQFPYKVKFRGCEPVEVVTFEKPDVPGKPHPNGGGFVADTATVAATAHVGPDALVLDKSTVSGSARIEDHAVIVDGTIADEAVISGHARVTKATVRGRARVRDHAAVSKSTLEGDARVLEHAGLGSGGVCGGNVTVKGIAGVSGGNQSGSAIIDGFYAKTNEITRGKWFTWSWGSGKNPGEVDADFNGLYADYDFCVPHDWMAQDAFGVTWGYLVNGARVEPLEGRKRFKPEAILSRLAPPRDIGDEYCQSIRGYLLPPATGEYTFTLAANNAGEFWLGEAGSDEADRKTCHSSADPATLTANVRLERGKVYPFTILHAEILHEDFVELSWTVPGGDSAQIVEVPFISATRDGTVPGAVQRIWKGTSKLKDLVKRPDYPEADVVIDDATLVLNGRDQFVELPHDIADFRNFTYTVSFRWDGKDGAARVFEFANPNGDSVWLSPAENGKLVFGIRTGQAVESVSAPAARRDVWTTVRVMRDGRRCTLFVNDEQVAVKQDMSLTPESVRATECYLGRGRSGGHFGGRISRFTVHSVPLVDQTPPSPNPPAFTAPPVFVSPDTVVMSTVKGTDPLGVVEYLFEEDGSGWNSGWLKAPQASFGGKDWKRPGRYRVTMRDRFGNRTGASEFSPAEGMPDDCGAYTVDGTGPTIIEAEHFARSAASDKGVSWQKLTDRPGFVGEGFVQAPDRGANYRSATPNAGRLDYVVDFKQPGRHVVWLRGRGVDKNGDSVHMGLDLKPEAWGAGVAVPGRTFVWCGRREFTVATPGIHTFSIWVREDGTIVDRILFATDTKYEPDADKRGPKKERIGEGPAESAATKL